jgi:hypothetical protein
MPIGSTIRNIAVVPPIGTELRRIASAVRLAETPSPIARLVPGNRLAGRAAICPAIAEDQASAIELPETLVITGLVVRAPATEPAEVDRIG